MQYYLVISVILFSLNTNFNVKTDSKFETLQECLKHEFYLNDEEYNLAAICMDTESLIEEEKIGTWLSLRDYIHQVNFEAHIYEP